MCAVINVPGAAILPESARDGASVTGWGTILVLVVFAAWVSAFWRDRHPFVTFIAGGILAVIGVSYLLLLVGAVAVLGRHPARLKSISLVVCSAVGLFVLREVLTAWGGALPWFFSGRDAAQSEPAWNVAASIVAIVALAVTTAIVFASRARLHAAKSDVRAEYEQRRADSLAEQMIRQAERERIARDMHDALAHRLSVVSLHAGALEGSTDGAAGELARTVREQTHEALQDMRGLIGDLRSGPGARGPSTMRAIGSLLAELRAGGVSINAYIFIESPERASVQLDSTVHRVVQESLTNAIKHAPTAPIDVFVQVEAVGGVRIRLVNPLLSGAASIAPGGNHGILGIRERAAALGGTAWIGAHEGHFIVDVTLPWQEREDPSLSSTGDHR